MVDCVVIVVTFRSMAEVARLLETVPDALVGLTYRVIVVNNDVTEDPRSLLAGLPHVEVIDTGANLGYAGGINVGLRHAPECGHVAFLNPDLRLAPLSLTTLCSTAGRATAAVPVVLDPHHDPRPSLRREPSIARALGEALFGDRWAFRPAWLAEIVRERDAYGLSHVIDWASGCALVVPAQWVERLGPWDERFFLYSEETDYCRRLRQAGVDVRFDPAATVTHRGGGSGTSDALHALLMVNKVRYFRKWHGEVRAGLLWAVLVLHCLLRVGRSASRVALVALLSPAARRQLPGSEPVQTRKARGRNR